MKPMKVLCLMSLVGAVTLLQGSEIRNGEDVLRAMHERYKESWYESVTFTQKSTTYNPDGINKVETWYEAVQVPGKLRIDIGPPAGGNGFLLDNGTLTILKDNAVSGTRPLVNMLLVLGFDVYRQDSQTTVDVVKKEGYDLSKLREDVWDGKPVYVVGAEKGDLQSRQFWVEKETLLFVREMEPSRPDPKKIDDIRFADYRRLAGGWIAARVEVHVEDKLTFSEDYTEIQVNPELPSGLFDPKQFSSTHWEKP